MSGRRATVMILAVTAFGAPPLAAQISPGPLAAPHAALEGSRNCLTCHRAGKGVDAALCLDCHTALADRIAAGRGLHAQSDHAACGRCHSEHNGREFALVFWPDGRERFDHAATGWPLDGRHAPLDCRACHRSDRVDPALRAREPALDPARTFLGLPTACASCHRDPHRGTLKGTCTDCHDTASWRPRGAFDHGRTRFPLAGAHARTACAECHRPEPGAARTLVFDQFAAAPPPACASCHRDPHAGRLGTACADCHGEESFRGVRAAGFDHARTRFPLAGAHRRQECAGCHGGGRGLRIAGFERCETCHRDPHAGQLRAAAGSRGCVACHTVERFLPPVYDLEQHQRTDFPLEAAHRAVPCTACHREIAAAELPAAVRAGAPAGARTRRYHFAGTACADCHRDPHRGSLDRFAGSESCRACHAPTAWRQVELEHGRTRFPLTGAHARVACAACHPRDGQGVAQLVGRPLDCAGCHRDVHRGQLALAGVTDCARCHDTRAFRPAPGFDHARAWFPLDGRHVGVACARCHPDEHAADDTVFVRYKPRPVECAACHAASPVSGGRAG